MMLKSTTAGVIVRSILLFLRGVKDMGMMAAGMTGIVIEIAGNDRGLAELSRVLGHHTLILLCPTSLR